MRTLNDDGSVTQYNHDGETLHMKTTFDPTDAIEHATALRNAGAVGKGHWCHVASLDSRLIDHLLKGAGISPSDTDARNEFLKKKLLDGTLSKFRVYEGTY